METEIGVIIVLYNSENPNYSNLIGRPDTSVILVDNTPRRDMFLSDGNVHYVPLKENRGIAAAQNVGIRKAVELGCSHIFFFDQDSVIDSDYIVKMYDEYNRLKRIYPKLAMLGPIVVNKETGAHYKTEKETAKHDCRIVSALISSGSMVETSVLGKVGLMEERLFIDCVDFEWCWRAESMGYICCCTERVELLHKVGQHDRSFLNFPIIISSPFRYYYQYRNFLWLLKRRYVPMKWKITSAVRKSVEMVLLPFLSNNGWAIMKNIFRGIKDGIIYKS